MSSNRAIRDQTTRAGSEHPTKQPTQIASFPVAIRQKTSFSLPFSLFMRPRRFLSTPPLLPLYLSTSLYRTEPTRILLIDRVSDLSARQPNDVCSIWSQRGFKKKTIRYKQARRDVPLLVRSLLQPRKQKRKETE